MSGEDARANLDLDVGQASALGEGEGWSEVRDQSARGVHPGQNKGS